MTTEQVNLSLSQLSLHSAGSTSEVEDWDRSMNLQSGPEVLDSHTPRNSVAFPADVGVEGGGEDTPGRGRGAGAKRTLSELLKLHAEKGTDVTFSQEEASRIAEVLGQWVRFCLPFLFVYLDELDVRAPAQSCNEMLICFLCDFGSPSHRKQFNTYLCTDQFWSFAI